MGEMGNKGGKEIFFRENIEPLRSAIYNFLLKYRANKVPDALQRKAQCEQVLKMVMTEAWADVARMMKADNLEAVLTQEALYQFKLLDFSNLIMPYYSDVLHFSTWMAKDKEIGCDVTQITMEEAWRNLERIITYGDIKKGLFTIAHRQIFKRMKTEIEDKELLEKIETETFEKAPKSIQSALLCAENDSIFFNSDFVESPEEVILQKENEKELLRKIQKLPLKLRHVFILHYYHDLSLKEIAKIDHVLYQTIESQHYRACKKLKKIIEKEEKITDPEDG